MSLDRTCPLQGLQPAALPLTYSLTHLRHRLLSCCCLCVSNPRISIEEGKKWKSQAVEATGVIQEDSDEGLERGGTETTQRKKET